MALGAERGAIAGIVLRQTLLLAGSGVLIGVGAGLGVTRLLRSLLYGVSATDPSVFAGASLFLLGVAALAAYLPARRATLVDPIVALRCE